MLKNLTIKNFRQFEEVTLQKLARINLIAGRNNVGKSSLLEAIELYAAAGSPYIAAQLLDKHEERTLFNGEENQLPLQYLFHQRHINKSILYIGDQEEKNYLTYTHHQFIEQDINIDNLPKGIEQENHPLTRLGIARIKKIHKIEQNEVTHENKLNGVDISFQYNSLSEVKNRPFLYESNYDEKKERLRYHDLADELGLPATRSVPTGLCKTEELARMWDDIVFTSKEQQVIQALQFIEPKLIDITFIRNKMIVVKLADRHEPIPLKSLGEGVSRLFQLFLYMVNAQKGVLLIDELENGLHYRIQPKIWAYIFQLAVDLDIIIFATTHSFDCIRSFSTAWEKFPELGSYHRLSHSKVNHKLLAVMYDQPSLLDAIKYEAEVR